MISYISSLSIDSFPSGSRALTILGSTGSIGTSALEVIRGNKDKFRIVGLAGARNIKLLADQANEFKPDILGVLDSQGAQELSLLLENGYKPQIVHGPEGYIQLAEMTESPIILSAMVGAAGLVPTMAAVRKGKIILLANKESLVLAGDLIRKECLKSGSIILPVDSEHNAIFQAVQGHNFEQVDSIIITASGGPFKGRTQDFMKEVTPEQALDHPNWSMGAKISIDSATMMNKGLEVIEAHYLFGITTDRIKVLVHPQSIVHSLASFTDGSLLAHMGVPDMMIPIAHCLGYPERLQVNLQPLDLAQISSLSFSEPDTRAFPCLGLALEALDKGPDFPIVLNAANEVCVQAFLDKKIGFMDIPEFNCRALQNHQPCTTNSLKDILEIDSRTRTIVQGWIKA